MGRAPRTKETLPDFLKWRRVTRHPLVFRGLTGSQRTPGFRGVTLQAQAQLVIHVIYSQLCLHQLHRHHRVSGEGLEVLQVA